MRTDAHSDERLPELTSTDEPSEGNEVLTLQQLIERRAAELGLSDEQLAQRSGDVVRRARWQQLRSGKPIKESPEPATVRAIADALNVDITTVWLGVGRALGLNVRRTGSTFGSLLPAGIDELPIEVQSAFAALARAFLSVVISRPEDDENDLLHSSPPGASITLGVAKGDSSHLRNPPLQRGDTFG